LIGVQWHPEMLVDSDAGTRKLFTAFKDSAAQFSFSQPLG
jgi:putative glutamine amidotransferase